MPLARFTDGTGFSDGTTFDDLLPAASPITGTNVLAEPVNAIIVENKVWSDEHMQRAFRRMTGQGDPDGE